MASEGQGRRPRYLEPTPPEAGTRRQYSFSRLTGELHARTGGIEAVENGPDAPSPLDPRGEGTLVHAVLEEIDFARPDGLDALLERRAERHLEHLPADRRRLDELREMIRRFLESPRAAEIASASTAHRELEFLLAWPPCSTAAPSCSTAAPGREESSRQPGAAVLRRPEPIYFQGFIDCLYCDSSGRWKVIDYKTNRVAPESLAAAAAGYEMQMLLYGLAVERILGVPPAELTLCFLRPGLEYSFPWNDSARRRVVELIDAALSRPQEPAT